MELFFHIRIIKSIFIMKVNIWTPIDVVTVLNSVRGIYLVIISNILNIILSQYGSMTPEATSSLTKWKDIATRFFERSTAGFWEFRITLKLSPKILVEHEPSYGIFHTEERIM